MGGERGEKCGRGLVKVWCDVRERECMDGMVGYGVMFCMHVSFLIAFSIFFMWVCDNVGTGLYIVGCIII